MQRMSLDKRRQNQPNLRRVSSIRIMPFLGDVTVCCKMYACTIRKPEYQRTRNYPGNRYPVTHQVPLATHEVCERRPK
jgi:hypothetical protein